MFAIPRHEVHRYSLKDRSGRELNHSLYGLRTNWNAHMEPFYPVKFEESLVDPLDQDPDMELVLRNIRVVGIRNGAAFPLRLTSRVLGPVDDQTVGLLRLHSWVITKDGAN